MNGIRRFTPRYYERVDALGNVYSQFGEDLLIEEVLRTLGNSISLNRWACEFGAWDGLHLSNTANLIVNAGYSAVLIEANPQKFLELKENMRPYPVECMNAFVSLEGSNTLDNLLSRTSIPINFDLLSIDIDGADYWILESLNKFRPKVIIIEYNPTIPKEVRFINPRDILITQGSSLRSLTELAQLKNYLVCGLTTTNIVLVDGDFKELFSDRIVSLSGLPDTPYVNRIWQTYDGQIHTEFDLHLLWHDMTISKKAMQVVPGPFLMFPDNMGKLRKFFFQRWKKFRSMTR